MPTSPSLSIPTSSSPSSAGSQRRPQTNRRRHVAAAVAVSLLALAGCTSSSKPHPNASKSTSPSPSPTYTAPPDALPVPGSGITLSTGPAPWLPPAIRDSSRSADYVTAAGFPYNEEMLQVHYHAHLDVVVDGKPVSV